MSSTFLPHRTIQDQFDQEQIDPEDCSHPEGSRSFNTFSEKYLAKCNSCNRNDEYDYLPLTQYLKHSQEYKEAIRQGVIFAYPICKVHNCYQNIDFLGQVCVWCETEKALEFQNDPLPEHIIEFIKKDKVYSQYQCSNCRRIKSKVNGYHRLHDSLKCICHLYPGVDLS